MTEQPLLPDPLSTTDLQPGPDLGPHVRRRVTRRRRRRLAAATVVVVALGATSVGLWPRDGDRAQTLIEGPGSEYVTGSWKVVPAGPLSPRRPYGVVAVGDDALVLGGSGPCADGSVCNDGTQWAQYRDAAAYDVTKRTWRRITDLPEQVTPEAVLGDVLVAKHLEPYTGDMFAYFAQTPRRWTYSVSNDTWERMPDPPKGELSLVAADGVLVAVPQDHGLSTQEPFDVYDTQSRTWQELPRSPLSDKLPGSPLAGASHFEVLQSRSGAVAAIGQDAIPQDDPGLADKPGEDVIPVLRFAPLDPSSRTWGRGTLVPPCSTRAAGDDALSDDEVIIQSLSALNARRDRRASVDDNTPVAVNVRTGTCSVLSSAPPYGSAKGRDGLTIGSDDAHISVGGAGPVLDTRTGRYEIYPPDIPRAVPSYSATTWVDGRFFAWGGGRDEQYGFGYGQEDYLMNSGAVWTP